MIPPPSNEPSNCCLNSLNLHLPLLKGCLLGSHGECGPPPSLDDCGSYSELGQPLPLVEPSESTLDSDCCSVLQCPLISNQQQTQEVDLDDNGCLLEGDKGPAVIPHLQSCSTVGLNDKDCLLETNKPLPLKVSSDNTLNEHSCLVLQGYLLSNAMTPE